MKTKTQSNKIIKNRRHIKIMLFVLLIFVKTSGFAQNFDAGIFIGPNFSKIDGIYNNGYYTLGSQIGGFTAIKISNTNYIRLEIKYIRKGNNSIPNNTTDYNIKLDYFEFPLLLEKTLPKRILNLNIRKELKIIGGVAVGKLFSTIEKDNNMIVEEEKRDPFNNYDFSGQFGIGVNFNNHFSIETRVSKSIISIRKSIHSSSFVYKNQYNNSISVKFVYKI